MNNDIVIVTNHAHKRWNQRVCKAKKIDIIKLFNEKPIEQYYKDFYIIDNDIVVKLDIIHKKQKDIIKIITTFGRISDTPALNNIKAFIKSKKYYGRMCHNINN